VKLDELIAWVFLLGGILTLILHRPLANVAKAMTESWVAFRRRAPSYSEDYYDQLKKMGSNQRLMRGWMIFMGLLGTTVGAVMLIRRHTG
jgi:hypothetical protein